MPLLRSFLLIFLMALATPLAAQDGAIATGNGTSTEQAQTDAAIATRIRDILHELDGYEDVTVQVKAGIVTLRGTTLEADSVEKLDTLVGRVEGVVAIENEVTLSASVSDRLAPVWDRLVKRITQGLSYLPLLAVALLAFLAISWLGFMIARREQPWNRLAPNSFIADIYRMFVRLAAVLAGGVAALDLLGATALLSTVLGAAGIVGLAIGFAVKDTVENFIASILMSIRQPFRPNDAVEIGGDEGKVIRLTSRATILLSWDGNHIRIPNSTVFKSRIVNYSRNPERRFTFELGLAYDADLAKARDLAAKTVSDLPFVLGAPAVSVWTTTLDDSWVGMMVAGWIDQRETDLNAARSEAIRQVLLAFAAAGIEMPDRTLRVLTEAVEAGEVAHPPARIAHAARKVADVGAQAEQELEALVDEERQSVGTEDLLDQEAPKE